MSNIENPDKPKINLQFPQLNKALIKDQKHMRDDDPRKGIIIVDKHAIVLNRNFCLVVNLYEYFTIEENITDKEELEVLKSILFYMNGKVFNAEYWNELTKGANMKMENGLLYVETPKYAKELHYKDMDINLYQPLELLISLNDIEEGITSAISLPFKALQDIYSTLKEFKSDYIILQFNSPDRHVKFTFKDKKYAFGLIMPHYESLEEGFRFEYLQNFAKNETVQFLLEDYKPLPVPEAPPIPDREAEILASRPESLFDHNGE